MLTREEAQKQLKAASSPKPATSPTKAKSDLTPKLKKKPEYVNPAMETISKGASKGLEGLERGANAFRGMFAEEHKAGKKYGNFSSEAFQAGAKGFAEGLLGKQDLKTPKLEVGPSVKTTYKQLKEAGGGHLAPGKLGKVQSFAGEMLTDPSTYILGAPIGKKAVEGAVKEGIAKATLNSARVGGRWGAGFGAANALAEHGNAKDLAKQTATGYGAGAALGGTLGLGGAALGKGIGAVGSKLTRKPLPVVGETKNVISEPIPNPEPAKLEVQQPASIPLDSIQLPFYPKGTNKLLAGMQNNFAEAQAEAARRTTINNPRPVTLDRGVDMSKLPDKYPLPDVSNLGGKALLERTRQQNLTRLPGSNPLALPEPTKPNWEFGTGKVDPEYQVRQLARLQKETVNNLTGETTNLKRYTVQSKEFTDFKRDIAALEGTEIQHAPEVFNNPEWQAANELVKANTGRDIVPFRGSDDIAGAQKGNSIFLNTNTKQPVLYVAGHEVNHVIEATSPETHARMMQILQEHIADAEGLAQHHTDLGYAPKDLNREALADAFGEAWMDPKFWSRVQQEEPGLLKTILDAIDRVIANVKAKVSGDMSIDPYLKDIQAMREKLADEYRGYLNERGFGAEEPGMGMAAKREVNANFKLAPDNRADTDGLLSGVDINPSELKDIAGVNIYGRDIWRNAERVFGDKFPQFKARFLDPLEDAKAKWIDHQRDLTDDLYNTVVDGLGIKKDSKESELVQKYGEGGTEYFAPAPKGALTSKLDRSKFISQLEKKHGQGNAEWTGDGAMVREPYDYNDLVREVGADRAADIVEAENWFRDNYDQIIDQVNEVRSQIYPNQPDKLIPKRQDYFRHFREMEGFEGIANLFDTPAQISPGLAGKSMYTKPKTKWQGYMQKRGMGKYKADAVGGFLDYVPAATYSIHIDPQAATFRGLENELAKAMGGDAGINNFLTYLKYFADDVQGKTNPIDRVGQEVLGRKVFKGLEMLNNRIKGNMVLANAGTLVAQGANIPQGWAFAKQHSGPGLTRYIASAYERHFNPESFAENNPMAQSRFLKERFSGDMYRRFDTKKLDKAKNVAVVGMEDIDRFATEYIWNSCYEKAISENIPEPIRYADFHARKLVAGRGIGEVPIGQKAKSFQLIAPFQVEVGNLWHVMNDMKNAKDWSGLFVILPLSLWLFNRGAEQIKGSGVTFDPLQAIIDAGKIAADDKDDKAYRVTGRLAGEVLSNIPLGQTVAASLPMNENERKAFFGREDPTRFGSGLLVAKGLKDPLFKIAMPFGGSQLEKTLKGATALDQGGVYTDKGQLKYPVSGNALNATKGLVFGPGAFKETPDYYNNDRRPLSDKQTQMVDMSSDRQGTYDILTRQRKIAAITKKINDIQKDNSLDGGQKRQRLEFLMRELRQVSAGK